MSEETIEQVGSDQSIAQDGTPTGYTVGIWAGYIQYHCLQCSYDTLERDQMDEHLLGHGMLVEIPTPPLAPPHLDTNGEGNITEIDLKEDQQNG